MLSAAHDPNSRFSRSLGSCSCSQGLNTNGVSGSAPPSDGAH